jgi:hypothetical protein
MNLEVMKVAFLACEDLKVAFLNFEVHEGGLPEPPGPLVYWGRGWALVRGWGRWTRSASSRAR